MDSSRNLPKVRDAEKESLYGYVHAVSGPGKLCGCIERICGTDRSLFSCFSLMDFLSFFDLVFV